MKHTIGRAVLVGWLFLGYPVAVQAETLSATRPLSIYKTLEAALEVKALRAAGTDEQKIVDTTLFRMSCSVMKGDKLGVVQRIGDAAQIIVAESKPRNGWRGTFGCRGWVLLDDGVEVQSE